VPLSPPLLSLHHVTATVDRAQADLDFFAAALGLRLVKRTVNFDNTGVYHFYYGDERGTPGTIWTTFPYGGRGVSIGVHGAGQITETAFSVPAGALDFWTARLRELGTVVVPGESRFGEPAIRAVDPSGLAIELVATAGDTREGWTGAVDAPRAVRGLHGVTLSIRSPAATLDLLTGLLGFEIVATQGDVTRLAVGGNRAGHLVDVRRAPGAPAARNGLGTVHHVAFAIADGAAQQALRSILVDQGYQVTPVLDRQYFTSIYFREPGGVLFEVATMGPGFAVDEPVAELGRGLKLPPWEEGRRAAIEAALPTVAG
jgi:glyoxalase family protein